MLHLNFGKNRKPPQVNGLLTGDGLQALLKGQESCVIDMVFPIVACFVDRKIVLQASCAFTRMIVQCTVVGNKVLFNYRETRRVESKLSQL